MSCYDKNMNDVVRINSDVMDLIKKSNLNENEFINDVLANPEIVKNILKSLMLKDVTKKIDDLRNAEKMDIVQDLNRFLDTCKSDKTRKEYDNIINKYLDYCGKSGMHPILHEVVDAVVWVEFLIKKYSPITVNHHYAIVKSFVRYCMALHGVKGDCSLDDYIIRKKTMPKKTASRKHFYSMGGSIAMNIDDVARDIETLETEVYNKDLKKMIIVMASCGLRVGALPTLYINYNGTFTAFSKGKNISGKLSKDVQGAVGNGKPFENWTQNRIVCLFRYWTDKLYGEGKIRYKYSCHDLRHYFAMKAYTATHDIFKVMKLLNHEDVQTTQKYLRGLGVEI